MMGGEHPRGRESIDRIVSDAQKEGHSEANLKRIAELARKAARDYDHNPHKGR